MPGSGSLIGRIAARHKTMIVAALGAVGLGGSAAAWAHPGLAALSLYGTLIIGSAIFLPLYVRFCIMLEDKINLLSGLLVPGRILRALLSIVPVLTAAFVLPDGFFLQLNYCVLAIASAAGALSIATQLAYRGFNARAINMISAYAIIFWLMGFAVLPAIREPAMAGMLTLSAIFYLNLIRGFYSDLRGRFPRRSGVGIFFGTFNPIHTTHVEIIKTAFAERNLERVYLHPTTIPKLHRNALANREIEFDRRNGMRIYRRTERADPNKDYFPTGNMFFEYTVRRELLKASLQDAGLGDRVHVLDLPELYEARGFLGIARRVRAMHPNSAIHGLHGSDPGGMWVRNIFEICGGITPYTVLRRNAISATAIRKGGVGMTTATVECFLAEVRAGKSFSFPSGFLFEPDGTQPTLLSSGSQQTLQRGQS